MHGQRYDHGDFARRQGLIGGLVSSLLGGNNPIQTSSNSNADPSGLPGSIIGGVTSALLPPQPSESSSLQRSVSLTSPPSSSSVSSTTSSSPSVLSSSSSSSSTLSTPSTTSTSSTSTPGSASVVTSSSNGTPIIVTATASASSTGNASIGTEVPKSFLQNKTLETGVFLVVGVVGVVIVVLLLTVWIRSSHRRRLNREALEAVSFDPSAVHGFPDEDRGSVEKLTRWHTKSSGANTHTTVGQAGYAGYRSEFRQGDPPAPPLPLRNPLHPVGSYEEPPVHHGKLPQGPGYNGEYDGAAYVLPRSPNPVYDPARTATPPDLNLVAATTTDVGSHLNEVTAILPHSQIMPPQRRSSLFDSLPASPSAPAENKSDFSRRLSSHSRILNPGMQEMPIAPALPAKFGSDEDEDDGERPYSGVESDLSHDIRIALKVANE